jgi:hypothetical protein
MANADREISLELLDADGKVAAGKVYPAVGGYGHKVLKLALKNNPDEPQKYTARLFIRPVGATDNTVAYSKDESSIAAD